MIKNVLDALKQHKIVTLSSDKPILQIDPPVAGLSRTGVVWMQETELAKKLDFIPVDKIEATVRSLMDKYPNLTMKTRSA